LPGLLLAQATSDNSAAGQNFTLWFPLGLFIIIAAILWVLYARPHRRVPPRRPAQARAAAGAGVAAGGTTSARAQEGPQPGGTSPASAGTAPGTTGSGPRGRSGDESDIPDDDAGRIV
jgi:hypothetical protein